MALYDADIPLSDVRYFRDGNGRVTSMFVAVRAEPEPTADGADEASFSGSSYLTIELFIDNPREVESLRAGAPLHVTLDVPRTGVD